MSTDHETHIANARAFVETCTREAARDQGWDVRPVIALVFQHRLPDSPGAVLEARELPVDALWEIDGITPPSMFRAAALALKMATGTRVPFDPWPTNADYVGAMFIAETWTVSGDNAEQERIDELRAWLDAGHKLSDHPDAYEAKFALLVDRTGLVALAALNRQTGETVTQTSDINDDEHQDSGGLAYSLAHVAVAGLERHEEETDNS